MIKELEKEFIGGGDVKDFKFTKITSSQGGFMYKVDTGGGVHYEVFERRKRPLCVDFKKRLYSDTNFKEIYPKSKDFGFWAWTYKNINEAKEKFSSIN